MDKYIILCNPRNVDIVRGSIKAITKDAIVSIVGNVLIEDNKVYILNVHALFPYEPLTRIVEEVDEISCC